MTPVRGYSGLLSGWIVLSEHVQVKEETRNFFLQHENSPGRPFCILSDTLPAAEQLQQVIDDIRLHYSPVCKIVLAIERRNGEGPRHYWELMQCGLYDIIQENEENDLLIYLRSLMEREQQINNILSSSLITTNMVGESQVWKNFLADVIGAGIFCQSSSVLLIGDSGTGKELLSRLIHTLDTRPGKKDLVLMDCTTIVPELSGSEFFGHERGSYTNALQAREGAFALANNGTLFLDEIGELPMTLQAELLRVIQEGTYKKVGSNNWQKTSFRLVSATNRNLRDQIEDNKFRQDLYFRMADIELRVPSLKERGDDILVLANHFLRQSVKDQDVPEFDDSVTDYLLKRDYPGNIRELRQLIRRIAMKHVRHKKITIGEIPVPDRLPVDHVSSDGQELYVEISLKKAILSGASLWDLKNKTMSDAIKAALQLTNGNKKAAAEKLGVTLRAVQQFLKNQRA